MNEQAETPLYLAVDGGGTKTKVLLVDAQGQTVGEGLSGPTSLTATSIGAASFNLNEAIRQAIERQPESGWRIRHAVMGLAGIDVPAEKQQAYKVFAEVTGRYPIDTFTLVNDIVIALESGTDSPNAVALISGTGSNCFGRNDQGQTAKTSGMGYILSDQGSGYAIGLAVLQNVVKSFDGRGESTILERLTLEHFRVQQVEDLKTAVYNPVLTKTEIAALSKLCEQAFEAKDEVASAIFDEAIDELFLLVSTVVTRLGITGKHVECVLAGSITDIEYIQDRLRQKLKTVCPQIRLVVPEHQPVHGGVKLALAAPTPASRL
ncbi:MAG: hypothetical protein COU69_02105 [Candidatus Pacebacteria bacterium CG10_big_fil_rev_8_21_14_0_10_56_10]|nr:MAG: hypothetical protein COU69_02105 [Candidatus Pacebacteria bacterium CG10_big_fil_rev_8_21_14_0_10_56_10]